MVTSPLIGFSAFYVVFTAERLEKINITDNVLMGWMFWLQKIDSNNLLIKISRDEKAQLMMPFIANGFANYSCSNPTCNYIIPDINSSISIK